MTLKTVCVIIAIKRHILQNLISKKLVSVLAIFTPIIEASKKDNMVLIKVLCINYLLCFRKDNKIKVKILINLATKSKL